MPQTTFNTGFDAPPTPNIMPPNLHALHKAIGLFIKSNGIVISNIRYRYFTDIKKLLILVVIKATNIIDGKLDNTKIKILTLYNYIKLYCIMHPKCNITLTGVKTIINTSGNFTRSTEINKDIVKIFTNGSEYLSLQHKYSNILISTACFLQSNIDIAMVLYADMFKIIMENMNGSIIGTRTANLLLFGDDSMNIIQYLTYQAHNYVKYDNIVAHGVIFNVINFMHCEESINVGMKGISRYNNINMITVTDLYQLYDTVEEHFDNCINSIVITAGRNGIRGTEADVMQKIISNSNNNSNRLASTKTNTQMQSQMQILNISCKENSCKADCKLLTDIKMLNEKKIKAVNTIKYPEMFAELGEATNNGYCEILTHYNTSS